MYYTKDGCLPTRMPFTIELGDGTFRTNPRTFTDEEIASAGWTVAPEVPSADDYNSRTHKCQWNTETSTWDILPIPDDEIARTLELAWNGMRHERNGMLAESDFIVVKSLERGEAVPTDWATYRQALRDITDTDDHPADVVFPTQPS